MAGTGAKILVVDDEPDALKYLSVLLEEHGYTVITAANGKDAFEKARQEKPRLITLDISMPGESGVTVMKNLQEDEETKEIPIILLTAVADRVTTSTYTHRDMLESEAEDYMPKPVEPQELLERIKSWL